MSNNYQRRVVAEASELNGKLKKLSEFIAGDTFGTVNAAERSRLVRQMRVMVEYSNILTERISAFGDGNDLSATTIGGKVEQTKNQ